MEAVQCDYCGKFNPNPAGKMCRDSYGGKLPTGWFTVSVIDGGSGSSGHGLDEFGEFCSRECISKHFGRDRTAVA